MRPQTPFWLRRLGLLASIAGLAYIAIRRGLLLVDVDGRSMAPAILDGDRVLVLRTGVVILRRGWMVLASPPPPWDQYAQSPISECAGAGTPWVLKRLAARPGDPFPQSTLPGATGRDALTNRGPVPHHSYFLLGDAPACEDSRTWGCVPAANIVGPVILRIGSRSTPAAGTRATLPG